MRSWRSFDPARLARAAAPAAAAAGPAAEAAPGVRILGLDPGSRRTGFGVIEWRRGISRIPGGAPATHITHVAHGCLSVGSGPMPERLQRIFAGLSALIAEHRPAEVAVERVFVRKNVQSALKLGQARGAALCAVPVGTAVFEYTASAVKQALAGSGAAGKPQVRHMIQALLSLSELRSLDASDALAVAVCHAHRRELAGLLEAQGASPAREPGPAGPSWEKQR